MGPAFILPYRQREEPQPELREQDRTSGFWLAFQMPALSMRPLEKRGHNRELSKSTHGIGNCKVCSKGCCCPVHDEYTSAKAQPSDTLCQNLGCLTWF